MAFTLSAAQTIAGIANSYEVTGSGNLDDLASAFASVGSAMTLSPAYDAAKTAATQTSVNAIPTTTLLSADVRLDKLINLDTTISSRLPSSSYTGPIAATDVATAVWTYTRV
jgi:hypothetical protein